MIIVLKTGTPEVEVKRIAEEMQSQGLTSEKIVGSEYRHGANPQR